MEQLHGLKESEVTQARAVQRAVDQRCAVVVLAVAGYDVSVHAGVG